MAKIIKESFINRILLVIIIIFVLLGAAIFAFAGINMYRTFTKEYGSKATAIAQSIADSSIEIILSGDPTLVQSQLELYEEIDGVSYVMVRDRNGDIIAHTFVPKIPAILLEENDQRLAVPARVQRIIRVVELPNKGKVLEIVEPILFGEIGIVHVGMSIKPIVALIWKTLILIGVVLSFMMITSIFLMRWRLNKIAQPLKDLKEYADNLSHHDFSSPMPNQSTIRQIAEEQSDEVGALSSTIVNMENQLIHYINNLKETLSFKHRLESELSIGRDIQMNMLPKPFSSSEFKRINLDAIVEPAKEVGGDFYDYFIKDNHLIFTVGDVSGKGVSAALFMSMTMMLIRSVATSNDSVQEVMAQVNRQLVSMNDNMLFVTTFLGRLNIHTGELEYVNAGHPSPLLGSKDGISPLPLTGGMALGVDRTFHYRKEQVKLPPDSRLLIFSDGITEAMNTRNHLFGDDRLIDSFSECIDKGAHDIKDIVHNDVKTFAGDATQSDDITLMAISWSPAHNISDTLGVHFKNELSEVAKLHQVVEVFCNAHSISDEIRMNINLVLEELLVNVISYGYDDHDLHHIKAFFQLSDDTLMIRLEDDGIPFNPLEAPDVDLTLSLEEMNVGGLGIHLVKTLMDDISYERNDNQNIVTITKSIKE